MPPLSAGSSEHDTKDQSKLLWLVLYQPGLLELMLVLLFWAVEQQQEGRMASVLPQEQQVSIWCCSCSWCCIEGIEAFMLLLSEGEKTAAADSRLPPLMPRHGAEEKPLRCRTCKTLVPRPMLQLQALGFCCCLCSNKCN